MLDVAGIQSALKTLELDAWLLYDFHGINPVARRVIGLGSDRLATRRWFGLIPATGEPIWLHHAIEAHLFAELPGRRVSFVRMSVAGLATGMRTPERSSTSASWAASDVSWKPLATARKPSPWHASAATTRS